ncbi:MAG: PilT/PilU family type 4a pilus ATPase [Acidobacteriota bacterium]|nr:MAG: PilT/PilU family type 4a pilus ATPase [Acidobacteriota bacterium]
MSQPEVREPLTTPRLDELLRFVVRQEASDLHLKPTRPPLVRVKGRLLPIRAPAFQPDALTQLLLSILNDIQRKKLEQSLCVEFGHSVSGLSRFRATVFYQRGTLGAVFRRVPFKFPSLAEWGLPDVISELADLNQGLVLITGPTGSGKSSTLAALIHQIVQKRLVHVVTIEDPIEFLLTDGAGFITQREVGADTPSFGDALRNALRQDPDVIMVGENRDLETMTTTLTAAETGHLVLTTLHTNSAAQTIDRIIDMFPAEQQRQVREQLAEVLRAVVSMQLVERADGSSMVAAVEILRDSPRVSKLVKEGTIGELREEMEKSVTYHKMQTMNQSLAALVIAETVSTETALTVSNNPGELDLMLRKFFYAGRNPDGYGEDATMPSDADYSRIHKLMEIERLYDESQETHRQAIEDKEARIRALEQDLRQRIESEQDREERLRQSEQERERASRALESQRAEYETKIERLQARIRELTAEPTPPSRSGLFRRS